MPTLCGSTSTITSVHSAHLPQDYLDFAGLPDVNSGSSRSDRLANGAALMLPVGPALVVIVLLSLGLWSAIWVATPSFFSP
jgi:hypothetical protein